MNVCDRERNWKVWRSFIGGEGLNLYLPMLKLQYHVNTLLDFYVAIRDGGYGQEHESGGK